MKKSYILIIIMLLIIVGCSKKIVGSNEISTCPNCVFSYYEEGKKYGSNPSVLKDYTNDYTSLKDNKGEQRKYFLGHVLDKNGKISRSFACGIEDSKVFCLEGTSNGSKYESNVNTLKEVYGEDKCEEFEEYIVCKGELIAGANKNGHANIGTEDIECMALNNETMVCD